MTVEEMLKEKDDEIKMLKKKLRELKIDKAKKIAYEKPSEYQKVCIGVSKEAYELFQAAVQYLNEETGLEKRYCASFLLADAARRYKE